jgi:hypothetical protein
MTREEFALFAMAIKTYYPKENILPNEQAMELWFRQIGDIPYKVAETALNKWVALNKWSPAISDIREMSAEIMNGQIPDWGEAWKEVSRAITSFGSYRPQEALESMSPLTREAVERMGFVNICKSENPSAERANFRLIYESLSNRHKQDCMLSPNLKDMISSVSQKMLEEKK